ncbi:MAG: HYR domain-containing protein [Verrucomicrobia bacterium]|nr:HYR domain-containing protein [Verrucomicrobiota bacterium]
MALDFFGKEIAECKFTVTVTCPPPKPCTLTCPPDLFVTCTSADGAVATFDTPALGAGCPKSTAVKCTPPSGSVFPPGATIVRCVALDSSGKETAECNFTVTVTCPPPKPCTLTCPPDLFVTCTSADGAVATFDTPALGADCPKSTAVKCTPPSGSVFPPGATIVRCVGLDSSGKEIAECKFTITVTCPPPKPCRLVCPKDRTVSCGVPWNFDSATIPDDCTGEVKLEILATTTNQLCGSSFVAKRTWKATDKSGNSEICTQSISLIDTEPPEILYQSNVVVRTTVLGAASVDFLVMAQDTCDASPKLICDPPSGSLFPLGTNLVTCTAIDACGNSSHVSFTVAVVFEPECVVVEPLPNIVVECETPEGTVVNWPLPNATNVCLGGSVKTISWKCSPPQGLFPPGSTVVTCESSPLASGESLFTTFIVTITGRCPDPCVVIRCPTNLVVQCESSRGSVVSYSVEAENVCALEKAPVLCDPPSGSVFPPGLTEVTCQATSNGKTNQCRFTVEVTGDCTPRLRIDRAEANGVVISWPALAEGFALQETDAFVAESAQAGPAELRPLRAGASPRLAGIANGWRKSTQAVVQEGNRNSVRVTPGNFGQRFYRLDGVIRQDARFVRQLFEAPVMTASYLNYARITMRNTGTTTWQQDVQALQGFQVALGSVSELYRDSPDRAWPQNRVRLPVASVAPGEEITFEFSFLSPAVPGDYAFHWRVVENNMEFGDSTPPVNRRVLLPGGFTPMDSWMDPLTSSNWGLAGTPTVIWNANGTLEVFTIQHFGGSIGNVVSYRQAGPSSDSYLYFQKNSLQGLRRPGWTDSPAVAQNSDGRLEVFLWAANADLDTLFGGDFHHSVYLHWWQEQPNSFHWSSPEFLGTYDGYLGPDFTEKPTVAYNQDGRLLLVGRYGDVHHFALAQAYQRGFAGLWSPWEDIGSGRDSGGGTAAISGLDGSVHVFTRSQLSSILHIAQTGPNEGWTNWEDLGAPGDARSAPAVGVNADGRLEVFVRGSDDRIWHKAQRRGGVWQSEWSPLGGGRVGGKGHTPVVVTAYRDLRLQVFITGLDGSIQSIAQNTPNGTWPESWQCLGGAERGVIGDPAVGRNVDGRLEVFAVASHGYLIHLKQRAPGIWR